MREKYKKLIMLLYYTISQLYCIEKVYKIYTEIIIRLIKIQPVNGIFSLVNRHIIMFRIQSQRKGSFW